MIKKVTNNLQKDQHHTLTIRNKYRIVNSSPKNYIIFHLKLGTPQTAKKNFSNHEDNPKKHPTKYNNLHTIIGFEALRT